MTTTFFQLKTHWTADEAYLIISFLDQLRDSLWEAYGDEIMADFEAGVRESKEKISNATNDHDCDF